FQIQKPLVIQHQILHGNDIKIDPIGQSGGAVDDQIIHIGVARKAVGVIVLLIYFLALTVKNTDGIVIGEFQFLNIQDIVYAIPIGGYQVIVQRKQFLGRGLGSKGDHGIIVRYKIFRNQKSLVQVAHH